MGICVTSVTLNHTCVPTITPNLAILCLIKFILSLNYFMETIYCWLKAGIYGW